VSMTRRIQNTGQGSFTRKVRTIFTVTIIVSIFVKLFLILVLITLQLTLLIYLIALLVFIELKYGHPK
jgi:uncharacterized membrane protein